MFDKLIESEPQGADLKNRRRYFLVSSVVVGILFTTAVVVSIFAADYALGDRSIEIVEMIAPVKPSDSEPEPIRPRPQPQNSSPSPSQLPTRQINMPSLAENPTVVPDSVSTVRNTQMARPDTGRFILDPRGDSEPGGSNGTGRDTSGPSGPGGLVAGDNTSANSRPADHEETPPPPIIKKNPTKTVVSKGVLNGQALNLPKPTYPAIAKNVGAQGQVTVQVTIDESGRVISANAVSGHLMLRPEAERAARIARFSPTLLSDVQVKVTGIITYNFVK